MISIFRAGSPSQAIGTLLILLFIRIPAIVNGIPLLSPELKWMLVGERMSRGNLIYRDIWDNTAPLAAAVYWVIDLLFGRSQLTYQVAALVLVMGQTLYFNYSMQRNQVFSEKTALPALLFVLCMNIFPDFFTLSPVLLGLTFLLFALDVTFRHFGRDTEGDEVFAVGFHIGTATLFYLPLAGYVLCAAVGLLLLTAVRFRKFFLLLFGFAFPIALVYLLFYLLNGQQALQTNWLNASIQLGTRYYASLAGYLLLFSPFILLILLALRRLVVGETRFINYQIRCQQFVLLWTVVAALSLFFTTDLLPVQFMLFVPVVVFFGTHYFLLLRRRWVGEIVFWIVLISTLAFCYAGIRQFPQPPDLVYYERLVVHSDPETAALNGQHVLIIGDDLEAYRNNTPATPYLNWRLAQRHFNDLDNYTNIIRIYENIEADPPGVIVDKQNKVGKLFDRMPALAKTYQRQGNSNVYIRKSSALGNRQ